MFSRSVSTNNDRDCSLSSVPHFDATTHVVIRGHAFPSSISVVHHFLDRRRKAFFFFFLIVGTALATVFLVRELVSIFGHSFTDETLEIFCLLQVCLSFFSQLSIANKHVKRTLLSSNYS